MGVENPSTGEIIEEIPQGTEKEVNMAVESARNAFSSWKEASGSERAEYLNEIADIFEDNKERIARKLTMEQGKSVSEAKGELGASIKSFRYYARKAREIEGRVIPTDSEDVRSVVIKQPVGPIAAISPWNYPVLLISWKIAPALAAGCTVVGKPASLTPLAVTELFKCFDEADLPSGVVNLVTGPGSSVGAALVEHEDIKKIGFTGQTETGKSIMKSAADTLKKITLELGGHCPQIVASDADFDEAVDAGVYRSFRNMGQICNSINRIYVEEEIYDDFVESFVEKTEELVIDDGIDNPDADLGPMANKSGIEKTKRHIEDAVSKGATLECGGEELNDGKFERGYYFKPAVLTDVNHDMLVMNEETFGPVAPIMEVSDLDEAVKLSNDTKYGLVSYLFTGDLQRGLKAAEELEYGTVGINNVSGGDVPYPYSGWKQSGIGVELSDEGLDEYLETKHVRIKYL